MKRIVRSFSIALLALTTLAIHAAAPVVLSVSPAEGATQVPTTTPLVITFDQAMDTTVQPVGSVTGFTGNFEVKAPGSNINFFGNWSADGKTLTITPTPQYLYATYVWTLNPPGVLSFLQLKSKTGVALTTVSGTFSTGVGGANPQLGSTSPANAATGVALDAGIIFRFDQAMKTDTPLGGTPGAVTWAGTGIDSSKFQYSWSADQKTLTATYSGGLPKNTSVNWVLNPSAAVNKLTGQNGKALASDTFSGLFTTGNGEPQCLESGLPQGWGTYGISKRSSFRQTSSGDPVEDTEDAAFVFSAVVTSSTAVAGASVTLPNGNSHDLFSLGAATQFFETAVSENALNTAFPPGNYALKFTLSGQAERNIPMVMSATPPPPIPKISNYDEAQTVNPATDFTLRWNAFTGAAANDHISMYISDTNGSVVFQAPNLCVPRPLAATDTSIVIPANTLRSNVTYTAAILFGHLFYFSTNTVPLMSGFGDLVRNTSFTIKTVGGGSVVLPAAARFVGFRLLPNGNPEFNVTGTASKVYTVQRTGQVASVNWTDVGTATMAADGTAIFEDKQTPKSFPLFYRLVAK